MGWPFDVYARVLLICPSDTWYGEIFNRFVFIVKEYR